MNVRILGTSCPKCRALERRIRDLNSEHHLNLEIEKVTDIREMMRYGILATPGLVIDGTVKSSGSVPNDEELLQWLKVAHP